MKKFARSVITHMNQSPTDDANPYSPPTSREVDVARSVNAHSPWKFVLTGTMWSIFSAFPLAALMALAFRFPVPFAGYLSGPTAVIPAVLAVFFYGVLLGGFVLVGVLGAIGGMLTPILMPKLQRPRRAVCFVSVVITFVCLSVLAILDYIVGPW